MSKKTASPPTHTSRPPIVTIMGHVDHGKTTLLDAIRQSHLVDKEEGGITQHIGAYQVENQGQKITFIDTPGHAAFSKMRERGANVTDIVVLVVAANDGVKPQTVESIKHIHQAQAPFIVAINKIDLPGASADMVKAQLTEHEVFVEGYGGQTPAVELSALQNEGINDLLEMILLVAELQELEFNPKAPLNAIVIESHLDKTRGPFASAIIKEGTLKIGDPVFFGPTEHKVRALFNELGKRVSQALPGDPVGIIGLKNVPEVGVVLAATPVQTTPTPQAPTPIQDQPPSTPADSDTSTEADNKKEVVERPEFNLILKADTAGTLEAVIQSAIQDEVTLVLSDVGPITESDVLLAQSTRSLIIGFNVPVLPTAQKLAKIEKVTIKRFSIIYKLIEFLEEKILTLIEPTLNEEALGEAEIVATFDIRGERIAGCRVVSGQIDKNHPIHLVRLEKIINDSKIKSLKRGKEDIKTAKSGSECGIILQRQLDIKAGDRIKSYRTIED